MAKPGFRTQLDVLVGRNTSILLGAPSNLFLLLIQPPLLGYVIGLAWQNSEAEATTYFSMTVAAVYLGCMNACCLIVRERTIFDRERMFDLSIWAYLISKVVLLSVINAVQMGMLLAVQGKMMHLPGSPVKIGLLWLTLTTACITASGLGLLISSVARSSYGAVIAVPSLIVPQIVFSEIVLQSHIDKKIPSVIQKLMIAKWCYDGLDGIANDGEATAILLAFIVMGVQLFLFLFLSAGKLALDEV